MIKIFINGLILCAGLIVSIGPQNTELLRVALSQKDAILLASTYVACDVLLIFLGTLGFAKFVSPRYIPLFLIATIFLLIYLAIHAFMRAYKKRTFLQDIVSRREAQPKKYAIIFKGIGLSLLNPLALFETLVILNGASLKYPQHEKIIFALGAISASTLWFYGITYCAKRFSNFFHNQKGQMLLDYGVGSLLLFSALILFFRFFYL